MFKVGQRVETTMGIRQRGEVIPRFYGPFTDGQYRQPEGRERPVYVRWEDGTKGWIQEPFLRAIPCESRTS